MTLTDRPLPDDGATRLKAIGFALGGIALFGLLDMQAKYLGSRYPVSEVVWARYAGHFLLMLLVLAPRHGSALIRTKRLGLQMTRSLLLLLSTAFFFTAVSILPLAEAAAIGFVSPLLLVVLSIPMLGEKVGWRRMTAVVVGFSGVLLILRPGGSLFTWAALLPLATAVSYSLYQILTRKIATTENPVASLFYTSLVGAAVTTLVIPFVFVMPDWQHLPMFASLGVLGGVGHFLMIKALNGAPASVIAPFSYSAMIWSLGFGYIVFGNFPEPLALVGIGVIVASGIYVAYRESVLIRARRKSLRG